MAVLLMSAVLSNLLTYISYVLGSGSFKVVGRRGTSIFTSTTAAQSLVYHIRLAQVFYGSGLTYITGFEVSAESTAVVYGFLLGGAEHCNIVAICDSRNQPVAIDDTFINASWYERESSEMLGLTFTGSRDGRSLLLPYSSSANPLKKIMPSNATSTLGYSRLAESLAWFQI